LPLFLFVLVVVFLELSFFFEKQFLEHPAPLKISCDLEQCPVVLNVLLYDETFHKKPPKAAAAHPLTIALDQNLFANLYDYSRMEKISVWKPIATAPAEVDLELSVYAEGEFPCRLSRPIGGCGNTNGEDSCSAIVVELDADDVRE